MSPSEDQTMDINTVEVDYTEVKDNKLTMSDLILIESKRLAAISKELKQTIDAAKTPTKKKFYTKKLIKNNDLLGDMLIRLNQLHESGKQDAKG
jgi:hypothetical protein